MDITTAHNSNSGGYVKSLDGLRAISIILVLFFHSGNLLCGWVGVQVFFVLSGYLITQNLLKSKSNGFSSYIKNFYWHRSLRIFPLYFGFLTVMGLIYLSFREPIEFKNLALYLFTYTYNLTIFFPEMTKTTMFNHFWSLCVEEQFYLMWPFIVYFSTQRFLGIFITFILLAAMPFRYLLGDLLLNLGRSPEEVGNNIYWFTLAQIDSLMLGAFVAYANITEKVKKPQIWFGICFLLFLGAGILNFLLARSEGVYFAYSSFGYPIEYLVNDQHVWSYTVINLTAATLMVWAIYREVNQGMPLAFLAHPWMVRIGKISYGMYVFHVPVLYFVTVLTGHVGFGLTGFNLLNMVLYLSLTYLISELSYRYFESYFLRLKKVRV